MKRVLFEKFHELNELKTAKLALKKNCREDVKVLIIDDEDFLYLDELRAAKFNITKLDDIQDILAAEAYPIVISDIKGVGKKFGSKNEGIYVVEEIKKRYPFKQYAIYSSSVNQYGLMALPPDVFTINKDVSVDEWTRYIDELIRRVTDPSEVWKKIRDYLTNEDISLLSILRLESEYVDLVINHPDGLESFPSEKRGYELSKDVRGVIQSLVAGVILAFAHIS